MYISRQDADDMYRRLVITKAHIGAEKLDPKMASHVFCRSPAGHHVLNLAHTVEKIALAARILVATPRPQDVCVVASRNVAGRPAMKFAQYTGATAMVGRWTAGTLTNQITKQFMEPRVVIVANPEDDHQAIAECSRANICVIALCSSDSPLNYVDVAIPCNNRGAQSLGLVFWLLCREIRYLKNLLPRSEQWEVLPDIFMHREETQENVGEDADDDEEDAVEEQEAEQ